MWKQNFKLVVYELGIDILSENEWSNGLTILRDTPMQFHSVNLSLNYLFI